MKKDTNKFAGRTKPRASIDKPQNKLVASGDSTSSSPSPSDAQWQSSAVAFSDSTLKHLLFSATPLNSVASSGGSTSSSSTTCSVTSFNAPANRSGQKIGPGGDPGTYHVYESFNMLASFSGSAGHACRNCSYRQCIRGSFAFKLPGDQNWTLVDKLLTPPSTYLEIFTFHEDGDGQGYHFGLREVSPPLQYTDEYTPLPRLTGCSYKGEDVPGSDNVPNGVRIWIQVWIEGKIVETNKAFDACGSIDPKYVYASATWQVYLLT